MLWNAQFGGGGGGVVVVVVGRIAHTMASDSFVAAFVRPKDTHFCQ